VSQDWDHRQWKDGDTDPLWTPNFEEGGKFLIDILDDAEELFFFSLFITDDVLQSIVLETNRYAAAFPLKNADKLGPKSRLKL